MSENIFDKRRLKTFSNCQDLVKSMVGTKDGIIGYNEHFRLDLESTCYKANMYEDLWKENQQLKNKLKYWVDIYTDLKKWIEEKESFNYWCNITNFTDILNKMKELEKEN